MVAAMGHRQTGRMPLKLSDEAWGQIEGGRLTCPDGRTYDRRVTRASRTLAAEIVTAEQRLVTRYWAGGELSWFEGLEAARRWEELRSSVVQQPRRGGDVEWTAGLWEAPDGVKLLLLDGHC